MTESRSPGPLGPALLGLLAAIGLAGCGSTVHESDHATLRVAVREYRITPQKADVAAGSLTVRVFNDGRLTHSLVILDATGRTVASSQPIAPGSSAVLATSLSAGHYVMASGIQGDKADGLYGTLDVG